MDKLTGTVLILTGCAGLLGCWYDRQKKRQRTVMAFVHLLSGWEYSLSCEKLRLSDFFARYKSPEPEVEKFLDSLLALVRARQCPTGGELWQMALSDARRSLDLDEALFEMLLAAGNAFFGADQRENIACARASAVRLKEWLLRERTQFAQKQKVYLPVGMLGGVLLVIFLL